MSAQGCAAEVLPWVHVPKKISPTLKGLQQIRALTPTIQPLQGCSAIASPTQRSVSATQRWADLSESLQDSKTDGLGRKTYGRAPPAAFQFLAA
jgi:hypothetical protein